MHFDLRPPRNKDAYIRYALAITKPTRVVKHAFWPFLRYTKISIKRKRDKNGKVTIKNKKRPIDYAAHADSLIYSWYAQKLSKPYEEKLENKNLSDDVIAYRALGKSNIDFFKEAANFLEERPGFVALAFDVSNFFGNISHTELKKCLCFILDTEMLDDDWFAVYKSITDFNFVHKSWIEHLTKSTKGKTGGRLCSPDMFRKLRDKNIIQNPNTPGKGIPQGSPISCVFANIYMFDLDLAMKQKCDALGGLYRRYSDDILFIIPELHANETELFFKNQIERKELNFSSEKTERWCLKDSKVYQIDETYKIIKEKNFSYLGVEFSGAQYYLRHRGIARVRTRIVNAVKSAQTYREHKKLEGLPGKLIWRRFGKIVGTFRTYRDRAFNVLGNSLTIKRQYSDRKVETLLRHSREKYDK